MSWVNCFLGSSEYLLFRAQQQPNHGWGVWLHCPGNRPHWVHPLRFILSSSGEPLPEWIDLIRKMGWLLFRVNQIIQECSLCLGRKSSTWTGMCLSEPSNSISVRRPSLSTSGTNTMEVNLPLWHLLRNFSPSLGFLRLMRAMEGEGKKQYQRTSFHQSFHHFLETGMSTWSPSSWWPTVSLWSCWSTQVKSYTLTMLRYLSLYLLYQLAIQAK